MTKADREAKKAEKHRLQMQVQKANKRLKGAEKLLAFEFTMSCLCCQHVAFFTSRERAVQFIIDNKDGNSVLADDAGIEFYGNPVMINRELTRKERLEHLASMAHRIKGTEK